MIPFKSFAFVSSFFGSFCISSIQLLEIFSVCSGLSSRGFEGTAAFVREAPFTRSPEHMDKLTIAIQAPILLCIFTALLLSV